MILTIAARQHGVVARSQLVESGVATHAIDYRLERGVLTPLHRGVYSAGPVAGVFAREFAAVLAAGAESFVSHRAAAAVLELVPPLGTRVPVAVSTRRDVRIHDPRIRIYRVRGLPSDEVMMRQTLPVTTAARSLLDLAGTSDSRDLERTLATALRKRRVERAVIDTLLERHPRHPGSGRLRALLSAEGGPAFTRSEAERRFLDLVLSGGLPRPETNVIVEGFEVDFLWRKARLIVEVDGREYHSGSDAFDRDRDRDGALMAAGFRTMRVTWRQIVHQPRPLLVRIAQALVR